MREKFINSFMVSISDRFNTDDLSYIQKQLILNLDNYELTERCTDIAVQDVIPESAKAYIVSLQIRGLSHKTLKLYSMRLGQFFRTIRKPLNEITNTDIKIYLFQYQNEHGISNRTLDGIRTAICTFFKWATAEGYLEKDPTATIKRIKYTKTKRGYLNDEEMELLRGACRDERETALIEFFYSTGCRVSEVVSVNAADINFQTMELVVTGKGNKQRTVYINARAKVAIQRYLMKRSDNNPALFVSERKPHNRLNIGGIEKCFRLLGKRAGIQKQIHPHLIRHTTASLALQRGVPIENVRMILGHESLDTTLIYAETTDSIIKESHKKFVV